MKNRQKRVTDPAGEKEWTPRPADRQVKPGRSQELEECGTLKEGGGWGIWLKIKEFIPGKL